MLQVLNGLGLKFDTTALALTLSMVLMFVHFYVEHARELTVGAGGSPRAQELEGRFAVVPAGGDGQLVAMRRMAEMMMQSHRGVVPPSGRTVAGVGRLGRPAWAQMRPPRPAER